MPFWVKTVLLGQEVHYYMVYIAYFTELNLQFFQGPNLPLRHFPGAHFAWAQFAPAQFVGNQFAAPIFPGALFAGARFAWVQFATEPKSVGPDLPQNRRGA